MVIVAEGQTPEPYTGLRPKYTPDFWNDDGQVQYSTNCYSYAFDWPGVVNYGNGGQFPINTQPGGMLTQVIRDEIEQRSDGDPLKELLNLFDNAANIGDKALYGAKLDAAINGHTFATADQIAGNDLGPNEWVVYLVATDDSWNGDQDYHWYRQNFDEYGIFDGTWSHKPGGLKVTNSTVSWYQYADGTSDFVYGDYPITDPTQSHVRRIAIYDVNKIGTIHAAGLYVDYKRIVGAYVVGM